MIAYILVGAMLLGSTPVSSFNYQCSVPFYDYVERVQTFKKIPEINKIDYSLKAEEEEPQATSTPKKQESKPKEEIKRVTDNSDKGIKVPKECKWSTLKWEISKGVYGKIKIDSIGVSSNIVWGATQSSVDNNDIAISRQASYCGSDKPIIVMGHNTNSFSKLMNIKKGAKVIITTQYGVYIYEVYSTQIARATSDGKNIVDNKGNKVIKRDGSSEILQLYTCYDSNGARFVAKCKKINGTEINMNK